MLHLVLKCILIPRNSETTLLLSEVFFFFYFCMDAVIIIKLWSRKLILHCSLAAAIWRPPYYWSWAFISFFLAELWKYPTLGLEVGKPPKPDQLQRNSRNSVLTTTTHLLGTYTQYHHPPFVIFTVFYLILLDPILPWAYCVILCQFCVYMVFLGFLLLSVCWG